MLVAMVKWVLCRGFCLTPKVQRLVPGLTSLLCEDRARLKDVVRRLDAGARSDVTAV